MGALAAENIAQPTAAGGDLNLGFGLRGDLVGVEFGAGGARYGLTSEFTGHHATMMTMSTDMKLQPSLGMLEPYVLGGLGGHVMFAGNDEPATDAAVGGSLRLGLGVDFRFDNFALSARYLHSRYGFLQVPDTAVPPGAASDSLGVNATFYF